MSLLFRRPEVRAISYGDLWSTGADVRGLTASSAEGALRLVPVYAAWRLIADQGASLPLRAYRAGVDGSRQQIPSQPGLITSPQLHGSVFDWKQRALMSMLSRGNAVGLTTSRDGNGTPTAVSWLNPDRVELDESNPARLHWFYDGARLRAEDVVHVPAMVMPGCVWGVSPLKAFRTTIETGQAAQNTALDWFSNGAIPAAHFRNTAKTLSADDAKYAKDRYREAVRGRDVLVTGSDWQLDTIGVPPDEARFIETLKMTATQVASIYGIPPEMIGGETGSSLTYATVEQNALNFVTYALRPWLVRLEEALSALLPQPQYVRFNIDALVRADLKTRMEAHEIALRTGLETNDEGRALEDKPPLTDAQRQDWQDNYRGATAPTNPAPGGTA